MDNLKKVEYEDLNKEITKIEEKLYSLKAQSLECLLSILESELKTAFPHLKYYYKPDFDWVGENDYVIYLTFDESTQDGILVYYSDELFNFTNNFLNTYGIEIIPERAFSVRGARGK